MPCLVWTLKQDEGHLAEENIAISLQALFNLLRKHKDTGRLMDLPRRARPRKLSDETMAFLNQAMAEDDELTARRARCLLAEKCDWGCENSTNYT